tara:strand:+ start:845 stop:1753 length:909 start_codon:yes stop_codon:yes gene_type:complete
MSISESNLDLTIIIVNYRSWDSLSLCLNSIYKKCNKVLVVDNYSNDHKLKVYKKKYSWVNWIENSKNFGFSKACNIGAQKAKTKWLLFLNPDTIIPKNTLNELIPFCDKKLTKNIITINQYNNQNKNTYPFGIFPNFLNLFGLMRFLERVFIKTGKSKNKILKNEIGYPDWVSGSFFLIKHKDFKKLNGWEESYWMYCEDVDFCYRANKIGIKSVIINKFNCFHKHGGSSRLNFDSTVKTKSHVIISTQKYILKNFDKKYNRLIVIYYLFFTILELIILSIFFKIKRNKLFYLLKYYKKRVL